MLECVICGTWVYDEYFDLSDTYDVAEGTLVCVDEGYGEILEWIQEAYA